MNTWERGFSFGEESYSGPPNRGSINPIHDLWQSPAQRAVEMMTHTSGLVTHVGVTDAPIDALLSGFVMSLMGIVDNSSACLS